MGNAILALGLTVGFYVLAVTIAGVLIFLVYLEVTRGFIQIYVTIAAIVASATIIWSILPRVDRFVAPGPRLTQASQPRLFAEITSIAENVRQNVPEDVYLIPEVNAWVSQRGGLLGVGSRRVLAIGLPLLAELKTSQFRAVLAHEFGHHMRGDVFLGSWVYRTRNSMVRTLVGLRGGWVQLPFLGYAILYLRITQAVSRHQEYLADQLAARIAGRINLENALNTIGRTSPAWEDFWFGEMMPALNGGFQPPIARGFKMFLRAKPVASRIEDDASRAVKEAKPNPYDSHPLLRDRIRALNGLPPGQVIPEEGIAISLLDDERQLEALMIESMARGSKIPELKDAEWEDLSSVLYLPKWRDLVRRQDLVLKGLKAESIPGVVTAPGIYISKLFDVIGLSREDTLRHLNQVLAGALIVALVDQRWRLQVNMGDDVTLLKGEKSVQPFRAVADMAKGNLLEGHWIAFCKDVGIEGLELSGQAKQG